MKKFIPIIILIILIVGAGSFYGGMKYGESKNPANSFMKNGFKNFGVNGGPGNLLGQIGRGQNGASFNAGEIIAKDDTSITIKLKDGGSKIIFYSGSTTIGKTAIGAISDLNIGETINANGKTNQDGSITATNIQIMPEAAPENSQTPEPAQQQPAQ